MEMDARNLSYADNSFDCVLRAPNKMIQSAEVESLGCGNILTLRDSESFCSFEGSKEIKIHGNINSQMD